MDSQEMRNAIRKQAGIGRGLLRAVKLGVKAAPLPGRISNKVIGSVVNKLRQAQIRAAAPSVARIKSEIADGKQRIGQLDAADTLGRGKLQAEIEVAKNNLLGLVQPYQPKVLGHAVLPAVGAAGYYGYGPTLSNKIDAWQNQRKENSKAWDIAYQNAERLKAEAEKVQAGADTLRSEAGKATGVLPWLARMFGAKAPELRPSRAEPDAAKRRKRVEYVTTFEE